MKALRRLELNDTAAVATLLRRSFALALPRLAERYSVDENAAFVRGQLFPRNEIWGQFDAGVLVGYIAFHAGWIEHLYVMPERVGRGVGTALLDVAKRRETQLDAWTFQVNARARFFYEARGFVEVERTDGTANDEREPDMRYRWMAAGSLLANLAR